MMMTVYSSFRQKQTLLKKESSAQYILQKVHSVKKRKQDISSCSFGDTI
jgi:hypothetical protein